MSNDDLHDLNAQIDALTQERDRLKDEADRLQQECDQRQDEYGRTIDAANALVDRFNLERDALKAEIDRLRSVIESEACKWSAHHDDWTKKHYWQSFGNLARPTIGIPPKVPPTQGVNVSDFEKEEKQWHS